MTMQRLCIGILEGAVRVSRGATTPSRFSGAVCPEVVPRVIPTVIAAVRTGVQMLPSLRTTTSLGLEAPDASSLRKAVPAPASA